MVPNKKEGKIKEEPKSKRGAFEELFCLNSIRKGLRSSEFPPPAGNVLMGADNSYFWNPHTLKKNTTMRYHHHRQTKIRNEDKPTWQKSGTPIRMVTNHARWRRLRTMRDGFTRRNKKKFRKIKSTDDDDDGQKKGENWILLLFFFPKKKKNFFLLPSDRSGWGPTNFDITHRSDPRNYGAPQQAVVFGNGPPPPSPTSKETKSKALRDAAAAYASNVILKFVFLRVLWLVLRRLLLFRRLGTKDILSSSYLQLFEKQQKQRPTTKRDEDEKRVCRKLSQLGNICYHLVWTDEKNNYP